MLRRLKNHLAIPRSKGMWIGRILLLGVGSSYIAGWLLSREKHRNYIARWLKALRKTTRWLPRGKYKIRRLGVRTFRATLKKEPKKKASK